MGLNRPNSPDSSCSLKPMFSVGQTVYWFDITDFKEGGTVFKGGICYLL